MKGISIVMLSVLLLLSAAATADQIKQVEQPKGIPSFLGYVQDRFVMVLKEDLGRPRMQAASNGVIHIGDTEFDRLSDQFAVSNIKQQFPGAGEGRMTGGASLANYYKVSFSEGSLEDAMAAYRDNPLVETVEPIGIHAMFATPNDTYYSPYQWFLSQTNDDDVDAPEAWDIQTGSTSTIIALLDSGTRYYHPDLGGANATPTNPGAARGNMWINNAELNGSSGVDDDGNGYVDDWIGYDFISSTTSCWSGEDCSTQDNDPRDFNGHGTHTAGIMGMLTNDGYGMAGIAGGWGNGSQAVTGNGCKIMPLRMGYSYNYLGQEYGVVLMDAAAEAFYYAANNGAKIASCSWGSSNSGGIGAAATYFINNGGIIFVAAGNDGTQTADYLNGRGDCVSVAATDENDAAASFTTYGTWVDISAPGNNIYATYHDHTDPNTTYWAALSGTSMATPLTAGVAGLVWSQNPGWTASQVTSQLYSSADDIDAELASQYLGKMGAGRVNAYAAVNTGPPPAPVANFVGSPTSGTEPLNVAFTDQSTGSITSWAWTFGDGGTSTSQNPSHTYTSAGSYSVTLTVTGPGGSDDLTRTNYITVNPCVNPTANFVGSPTTGDYPLNVSFTNQSSGATSYSWNFGDGGTSTATSPSHTYTSAGTFTVTLTATNACGSDQLVRTNYITVTTPPCNAPVANFSGSPTSGVYPLNVDFTDLSTNSPTSWSWNFGDGGTSTSQNPSHTYTAAGTYTVTLTATNSCGSDGETKSAYISVSEPSSDYATLPYSTGFESGSFDQYWFTQSSNSEGRILITTANTPHSGAYHMTMDDNLNGGLYAQNEAWLRLDLTGKSQVQLTFWWRDISDETHTQDGVFFSSNGGSSFTKVYNLTNGTSAYQQVVLDLDQLAAGAGLSLNGTFVVKFQQYDNYSIATDGMAFDDISVVSMDVPPVAEFSANVTSGTAPLAVNFTDLSANNPTSWAWNFGDGGTSTAQNPSHTYTTAGSYTVTLTATNAFGSDGETKTGYITVNPPGAWTVITFDDFESGMGTYSDGGGDMVRYTGGTYAWSGSAAADIQDNSGVASSFYHTGTYNVSGYSEMEVEFYFIGVSMDGSENFWVQYFDGTTWQTVGNFVQGVDFVNNTFYVATVTISSSQYNFPTNARLRFMCDASNNLDDVYIDDIEWRGMGGMSSLASVEPEIPDKFELSQNYPNPFNPTTTISFTLPTASDISLVVYNILGQQVTSLADGFYPPGQYDIVWDASEYSSGVYFYRLTQGGDIETKKMMLLK
jgi:PKD repeat protein